MYVDDPDQAFGSWCVKGAGAAPDSILRPHRAGWSEKEREAVNFNYMYASPATILEALPRVDDPRVQRVLQHVYEFKRRHKGSPRRDTRD